MVVRQGPPQRDRRKGTDIIVGVLGVVALLVMVALFVVLPRDVPPPPLYEVSFEETLIDVDGQEQMFAEGTTATMEFPYDGSNLYEVAVAFEWTDDIASSLPDGFQVTLLDPEGNVVAGPYNATNLQPKVQAGQPSPTYTAVSHRAALVAELAPRPTTRVLQDTEGIGADGMTARAEQDFARGGSGAWQVKITLQQAGDCPAPDGFDFSRFLTCNQETGGEGDPGNPFAVTRVTFTKHDPIVTPL